MNGYRCPGQDKRFWKPDDIFEVKCPFCDKRIEFWKDDVRLTCERCGNDIPNPRLNLSCAKWCKFAERCVGRPAEEAISRYGETRAGSSTDNRSHNPKGEKE